MSKFKLRHFGWFSNTVLLLLFSEIMHWLLNAVHIFFMQIEKGLSFDFYEGLQQQLHFAHRCRIFFKTRKSQGLFGILLNCSTFSHRHLLDRQSRIYMRRALCKAQKTYGPALKPMRKRNVMKRFHISLQFMAQAQSSFMDHTHWLKIVQNVSFGFLTFGIYH